MGEPEDIDPRVVDQLRAYTALDNPIRLRAFRLIHNSPGIPFNEIAQHFRIESGLLAYHVGVLKAAGILDVAYGRSGRQVTSYRLSGRGKELYSQLFPPRRTTASKTAKAILRSPAAR